MVTLTDSCRIPYNNQQLSLFVFVVLKLYDVVAQFPAASVSSLSLNETLIMT